MSLIESIFKIIKLLIFATILSIKNPCSDPQLFAKLSVLPSKLLKTQSCSGSRMFSSEYSGPRDRNLPAWHGIICFRKYLTLGKILYLPDLRWLCYKLLFVRQALSSITLSGKPSNVRSCHLEADVFSTLTDSVPSLCLYLRLPSPHCSLCSLFRSYRFCKHLWFSIDFKNSSSPHCQPVSLQDTRCWRERRLNPLGTQTGTIHHPHIRRNNTPHRQQYVYPQDIFKVLYTTALLEAWKAAEMQSRFVLWKSIVLKEFLLVC